MVNLSQALQLLLSAHGGIELKDPPNYAATLLRAMHKRLVESTLYDIAPAYREASCGLFF